MKVLLKKGNVITPYRVLKNYDVLVEDGIIKDISPTGATSEEIKSIDCSGLYISPGFIDMHLHGGGGYDFMDGTEEAFIGASRAHLIHGTTSMTPTTLTCTDEELFNVFSVYNRVKDKVDTNFLGLHLEGPYFSPNQAGAQDPKYLKTPKKEHYEKILEYASIISRMSVAVELPGALELGKELVKNNIIASIGHSDADYSEIVSAYEMGYTHVTHLYSGMSTIHRKGGFRYLGLIESAYLLDGMTVEIIADGCHLPKELLEYIVKFKSKDKISLVTDSSRGASMPEGSKIILGSLDKGQDCIIEDGVAKLPDRSAFAGSVATCDRCVRTMNEIVGLPIEEAVSMMTVNPAKVLGIENKKGTLAKGYDADINIFDENINIKYVIVNGQIMFKGEINEY